MWDRPLGASKTTGKPAKPPRLPAPPPPQETSTPGSNVVPKSQLQSAQQELLAPKGEGPKPKAAPATKAQDSGDKKSKKKPKIGSVVASKKRKIAPDSNETQESDPLFQEHERAAAAKRIPK